MKKRYNIVKEKIGKLAFLMPLIRSTTGKCGENVPHVFESDISPPLGETKCLCGHETWDEAENKAWKKAKSKHGI